MRAGRHVWTIGLAAALALAAGLPLGASSASAATPAAFRWLVPAPAPAGWRHASFPAGGSVLSYPTSLARIKSDSLSVSVARHDKAGRILVYLNATPREGAEHLRTWPAFRIAHNRGESKDVHEDARAGGLPFFGGTGSCVIDHYVSRYHDNHYKEIACFAQGRTTASVIVAAALTSQWAKALPLLERAVRAYRVD